MTAALIAATAQGAPRSNVINDYGPTPLPEAALFGDVRIIAAVAEGRGER